MVGFRPGGTFVPWPLPDTAAPTEAFRPAALGLSVRCEFFEEREAHAMLAWPHSGFPVYDAMLVPEDDPAFALRLALSEPSV